MKETKDACKFTVKDDGELKVIEIQKSRSEEMSDRIFVSAWLFGWTIVCGALLWGISVAEGHPLVILFTVPFFAGWIAGAYALLSLLFGKETIVIESDQVSIRRELFWDYSPKSISIKSLLDIEVRNDEGNYFLYFDSTGRTVGFPLNGGLKKNTAESLASFLKQEIPTLSIARPEGKKR